MLLKASPAVWRHTNPQACREHTMWTRMYWRGIKKNRLPDAGQQALLR